MVHQRYLPVLLMTLAGGLLLALFFMPLWEISLKTPQFPEGVSLALWLNKVTSNDPEVLYQVNLLNKMLGLPSIEADLAWELTYFPMIAISLMVTSWAAAYLNNWEIYLLWVALYLVLGILGFSDLHRWIYHYGYELPPELSLQLRKQGLFFPLVGQKKLSSFIASSYPTLGTLMFCIAGIFSLLATFLRKYQTSNPNI